MRISLELRDTHHQRSMENSRKSIETGDMALIHDQYHPRGFWKMARRVLSLITGKDGVVRVAALKVAAQSGPPTTLR